MKVIVSIAVGLVLAIVSFFTIKVVNKDPDTTDTTLNQATEATPVQTTESTINQATEATPVQAAESTFEQATEATSAQAAESTF